MTFEQLGKDRGRVSGFVDPRNLKDILAKHGKLSPSFDTYTIDLPFGEAKASLEWHPHSVDFKIEKKPMLVTSSMILNRIKEEVEKAPPNT